MYRQEGVEQMKLTKQNVFARIGMKIFESGIFRRKILSQGLLGEKILSQGQLEKIFESGLLGEKSNFQKQG